MFNTTKSLIYKLEINKIKKRNGLSDEFKMLFQ